VVAMANGRIREDGRVIESKGEGGCPLVKT
jgi:hypothetical protein